MKAVSVIERELNKKVYHEAPVLLVAVGSYQATAAYNEWSVDNILKDFPNNVTGAVKKFDENLKKVLQYPSVASKSFLITSRKFRKSFEYIYKNRNF